MANVSPAGSLASPERLRGMFNASSVALVGASDTSGWARNVYESLRTAGFEGTFVPIHPRHPTAFGINTRPSLCSLEPPVDLAFVLVPTEAVESVVRDAAAAGTRNLVVLAAGFGEQGEQGRQLERNLVEIATAHGITLLGPNGLGFINAPARVAPYGLNISPPLIAGSVGVVLQSGALASAVLGFARGHAIGLSLLISMGNEAMITTADVIEYLIEDPATRVIALFLEQIRQPARFAALAERALRRGKPVVALKVGRSPGGQRTALAHTGAVAGDDAVINAALHQFGVIRVRSLEELLVTAGLLSSSPPLKGRRMGVVTASGGACDIIADRAYDEGIQIPEFAQNTVATLGLNLPATPPPDPELVERRVDAQAGWHERRERPARQHHECATASSVEWAAERRVGVWPESEGRRLLEQAGVPIVPARLVRSAEEAIDVADRLGYPVALKICGAGIAHKSDRGGVALGLSSGTAVGDAYARIMTRADAPEIDGVLVAAMRSGGHELFAGVTVDQTFGPVLAVGLGGIWVETLGDVALRVLPIKHADAREMLGELKAATVLQGARGGAAVDFDRVAEVLLRLTRAASIIGPRLEALDVNPLWCSGEQVEALDVLVVTD